MRHRVDDLGIFHHENCMSVCATMVMISPSPHCLANMMATYNILEKKLVNFASACNRNMYIYDVIRFNAQCSPTPTFYVHAHACISACPDYKHIDPYHLESKADALRNQTI